MATILVTICCHGDRRHHHEHGDDLGKDNVGDLGGEQMTKDDDDDGDDTRTRQYQGTPATKKRDKWSPSCDSGRRVSCVTHCVAVLHCFTFCCTVLQNVSVCNSVSQRVTWISCMLHFVVTVTVCYTL